NESEFSHQAANETLPLRDAFAVLFFVSVGMLFDPMILFEHPTEVLATYLIIVVGKSAAAYGIVRAFGKPNGTALLISPSLAQIGEFSFILAELGPALGSLRQEGQDLVLAGALLSIITTPLLFAWLDRRETRSAEPDPVQYTTDPPVPADLRDHVILVGFGRVGSELGRLLKERGVPLVVVDGEDHLDRKSVV